MKILISEDCTTRPARRYSNAWIGKASAEGSRRVASPLVAVIWATLVRGSSSTVNSRVLIVECSDAAAEFVVGALENDVGLCVRWRRVADSPRSGRATAPSTSNAPTPSCLRVRGPSRGTRRRQHRTDIAEDPNFGGYRRRGRRPVRDMTRPPRRRSVGAQGGLAHIASASLAHDATRAGRRSRSPVSDSKALSLARGCRSQGLGCH
jgi:hypothetical protein